MMANSKIFIIAEAGVNHNGSMELAKKMIVGDPFSLISSSNDLIGRLLLYVFAAQ